LSIIDTQKEFATLAAKSIVNHRQTFLLGGGHDIAYAHHDKHFRNRLKFHIDSNPANLQMLV
jgi:arginase family enzyme